MRKTAVKTPDATVKINARVYRRAKLVALERGITLSEYLSGLLAGPVDRDYARSLERMGREEEEDRGGRKEG